MDRRAKAAGITVLILLLGYRMSMLDLLIAAFMVCVYARSQHPTEVRGRGTERWLLPYFSIGRGALLLIHNAQVEVLSKQIAHVATPIGKVVGHMGGQIGKAVEGAVEKYELTPTPMKKKKQ